MSETTTRTTRATVAPGPGRLGNPSADPRTDPRMKPALLAALAEYGLDAAAPPAPIDRTAPLPDLVELAGQQHEMFEGLYAALPNDPPADDRVEHTVTTISGVDGNDIALHIYRPRHVDGTLPCIMYVHGGGMVLLNTYNNVHRRWCEDLAMAGSLVVAVDFRNGYTPTGINPFSAGLTDCCSAVRWIDEHRHEFGITTLVLQGESGGANLVLATALASKRDGFVDAIDGVYASVPYISGGYSWDEARKLGELPSLVENDGYFINTHSVDVIAVVYDPDSENAENPLCWPYHATESDVRGLPPHVITVNELDPLRDEGIAYHRTLEAAGVRVAGRVNLGLTHGAELIFAHAVPVERAAAISDITRFANEVSQG